MSQALGGMPPTLFKTTVSRRLKEKTGGLGYWAAVDAQALLDKRQKEDKQHGNSFSQNKTEDASSQEPRTEE